MSDLERELRAALHDDAASVTGGLVLPGDPGAADERTDEADRRLRGASPLTRRRPRRRGRVQGPVAAVAAVAASVVLVAGAVWGADHLQRPAPALPAGYEHTRQVHGPDDIPEALRLLPGVLAGIDRLQPVEDAAVHACVRRRGMDVDLPVWGAGGADLLADSTDLDPRTAARTGYGLARAVAAQRAQMTEKARAAARYGPRWENTYSTYVQGPLTDPPVTRSLGHVAGVDTLYGGCLAQVRRDMWGPDHLARLDMDSWPSRLERFPGVDDEAADVASVRARRDACLAAGGVPGLLARSMAAAGVAPGSNRYVAGTDIASWLSQLTIILGRDSTPTSAQVAAVLADEKRVAVVDARCSQSVRWRAVLTAASGRSPSAPARLLRDEPRLLDEVFDLDVAVRRLLRNHGLDRPAGGSR